MVAFAWVSKGRLHLLREAGEVSLWSSAFADQVQENARSIQRRHAWKAGGRGARFAAWGAPMPEELGSQITPASVTALSRGRREGEVLYVVQTPTVSAILGREEGPEPVELRLYHTADFRITDLTAASDRDKLACAVSHATGVVNIGLLNAAGSHCRDVTEGDSIDAAPSWSATGSERLVYQSAGVGRDEAGLYGGRGAYEIMALDFERGDVEELISEEGFDLLVPREAADGTLYYIRRPFSQHPTRASVVDLVKDVVFFPLRLGRAVLSWLHFFTVRYTGKPLITAAGPEREGPDEKWMTMMGNVVDVEAARRESLQAGAETPALVPQSWQLMRCRPGGQPEVVSSAVACFDHCSDGSLLYSNGRAVFHQSESGVETIAVSDHITAVLACR